VFFFAISPQVCTDNAFPPSCIVRRCTSSLPLLFIVLGCDTPPPSLPLSLWPSLSPPPRLPPPRLPHPRPHSFFWDVTCRRPHPLTLTSHTLRRLRPHPRVSTSCPTHVRVHVHTHIHGHVDCHILANTNAHPPTLMPLQRACKVSNCRLLLPHLC
jgi:hypothetical protein